MTVTSSVDRDVLGKALADTLTPVIEAFMASGGDSELLGEVLIDAGILVHSGLWAVPDDPGEELVCLAELPGTDDEAELDARLDDEGLLREALNRTADVYREGEPRPRCAPALYEIVNPQERP